MRPTVLPFALFMLACGCAFTTEGDQWQREASRLGIAYTEIVAIARDVKERYKMVVVRVEKRDENTIALYLADKPERPHGIVVVFRRVAGRWQEDPKSQDQWIV